MRELTIFDVPRLEEDDAWLRVRATLAAHPLLEHVYDEPFLGDQIRRRATSDGVLLLWLAQPDDEMAVAFWNAVVEDLSLLEPEGAVRVFRSKMRKDAVADFESWRTELSLAARLKRDGVGIVLEPPVGNGTADIMTRTVPEAYWEIKSPLDLGDLREDAAVQLDVQRRFRRIDEPYVLDLVSFDLARADVAKAAKDIKRQIAAFYAASGTPPHRFVSSGLVIDAVAVTNRGHGYLGTMMSKEYVFQDEHAGHVVKHILKAAKQIPGDAAGVVVIDRICSDWLNEHDVVDACFGVERLVFVGNAHFNIRNGGVFRPGYSTRISAVASYSRRWVANGGELEMLFLHNPYARTPLPAGLFTSNGFRHGRLIEARPGFFTLDVR
jgi:hypothetical protein